MSATLFEVPAPGRGRPTKIVSGKIRAAMNAAPLTKSDDAIRALAERLATELDAATEPKDIVLLAKQLRDLLVDMQMTPASRGQRPATPGVDPLEEIRGNVFRRVRATI